MTIKDYYFSLLKAKDLSDEVISLLEYGNEQLMPCYSSFKEIALCNGKKISQDVYIGQYPDNIFNAVVTERDNGILILINYGMVVGASQTSSILAGLHPLRIGDIEIAPDIAPDTAKNMILDIIIKYINTDQVIKFEPFYPSDKREYLAKYFYDCFIQFTIAHEISHILCDHLKNPTIKSYGYKDARVNYCLSSWEDEIKADNEAINLLKEKFDIHDHNERLFLGPVLFFEFERLRRFIAKKMNIEINDPLFSTHPFPNKRLAGIVDKLQTEYHIDKLPISSLIVSTFNFFRGFNNSSPEMKKLIRYGLDNKSRELVISLLGLDSNGITSIDYNRIKEVMNKDILDARKIIVFTAAWYASSEEINKEIPGSYLAMFSIVYHDVYHYDQEFIKLLHDEIPNLNMLMDENIHYLSANGITFTKWKLSRK